MNKTSIDGVRWRETVPGRECPEDWVSLPGGTYRWDSTPTGLWHLLVSDDSLRWVRDGAPPTEADRTIVRLGGRANERMLATVEVVRYLHVQEDEDGRPTGNSFVRTGIAGHGYKHKPEGPWIRTSFDGLPRPRDGWWSCLPLP